MPSWASWVLEVAWLLEATPWELPLGFLEQQHLEVALPQVVAFAFACSVEGLVAFLAWVQLPFAVGHWVVPVEEEACFELVAVEPRRALALEAPLDLLGNQQEVQRCYHLQGSSSFGASWGRVLVLV